MAADAQTLGLAAVRALYAEVALEPKPGLVSFRDCGSHADMDAETFVRSLFALRGYFPRMAQAGRDGHPFGVLENLGKNAEARMLAATHGINTHRGAILAWVCFAPAPGSCRHKAWHSRRNICVPSCYRPGAKPWRTVRAARQAAPDSNGQQAAQRFKLRSAGEEAAQHFRCAGFARSITGRHANVAA